MCTKRLPLSLLYAKMAALADKKHQTCDAPVADSPPIHDLDMICHHLNLEWFRTLVLFFLKSKLGVIVAAS